MLDSLALYIHWPFCKSKCPYCDFNSHVQSHINHQAWLDAYITEFNYFLPHIKHKTITSIFFGGGTPSLMPPSLTEALLNHIAKHITISATCEITLEANPTSVESKTFDTFRSIGVNRFSLGIQSLNNNDLQFLGREHSSNEAKEAIERAAKCTENYSFDLIYARPNQTVREWQKELEEALSLACNHLSLYQLTIEKGTKFYSAYHKEKAFSLPDDDIAIDLYNSTNDIMQKNGFERYEISNYAKPNFSCQHNLAYWRYNEYLGLGPGAHSRLKLNNTQHALMMIHHPDNWLNAVQTEQHGLQTRIALPENEIAEEILLTGLRLKEGLPLDRFQSWCHHDYTHYIDDLYLQKLSDHKLITYKNNTLCLTEKGITVMDSVIAQLAK